MIKYIPRDSLWSGNFPLHPIMELVKTSPATGVEIPNQADALFSLQNIVGDNMIDSINGWEFPINNKDWEDTDYTILYYLPWKTQATISAPADGTAAATAIQAIDTTNFWYEVGGAAKQIPIHALFNNIDFDNKIFCTHISRLTNSLGIETLPNGIAYISMYNVAQTIDASFTTFYGSDVEPDVGAYFVTKSGNDTTGDGSQGLPFLTIQKAVDTIKAATGGGKIYYGSGIFDEDNGSGYLYFDDLDVTYTLVGIGDNSITSPGITSVVYSRAAAVTFYNTHIDGETTTASAIDGIYNFAGIEDYPNFIFNKSAVDGLTTSFGNGTFFNLVEFNDSRFKQYLEMYSQSRKTISVDGSLVNYIKLFGAGNSITYSKIISESAINPRHLFDNRDTLTVNYNHFKCNGVCIETDVVNTRTGDYTIEAKYNVFEHEYQVGGSSFKAVWSRDSDCVLNVQYNKMVTNYTDVGGALKDYFVISTKLGTTSNISNNYIRSLAQGQQEYIRTLSGEATLLTVNNNYVHCDCEDGQLVTCTEGTNQTIFNGSTFAYNRIIGCYENRGYAVSGGCHGMLVSQGKEYNVYGNYISHCPLGFVWKQYKETSTTGGVWANVFYNNLDHIYVRRSDAGWIYNNTFMYDSDMPSASTRSIAKFDDQYVDTPTQDWKFRNNISVYNGSQPFQTPLWFEDNTDLTGFEADDNVFFGVDTAAFIYEVNTLTTYTQAQSITNGWAANIDNNNPNLVSMPDSGYPTTPINGVNLGATYEDCLDTSSVWNYVDPELGFPLPKVVLKTQGTTWQKGAFVQ